jgi:hypothetical protein
MVIVDSSYSMPKIFTLIDKFRFEMAISYCCCISTIILYSKFKRSSNYEIN